MAKVFKLSKPTPSDTPLVRPHLLSLPKQVNQFQASKCQRLEFIQTTALTAQAGLEVSVADDSLEHVILLPLLPSAGLCNKVYEVLGIEP